MYFDYFGLKENPFSITPDPQFRYHGRREREAMAHFQYGLSVSGGFVQLTGEVGTGKTMLIRALLEELPDDVVVALVLNPVVTVLEFMAVICDELWIKYPKKTKSLKQFVDILNQYLLANHSKGRRTVLIMDEAQNLSREVLEQVRLLTNLETSKNKLLQIILVGQPELNEKLASHDMRQLAQRITARYKLDTLGKKETREYIAHRCKVAGANHPLFTRSGMSWVHRLAKGNPRMTNIICDRALLGAYSDSVPLADGRTVRKAALEVGDSVPGRRWYRPLYLAGAGSLVTILLAIVLWSGWFGDSGLSMIQPETRSSAESSLRETPDSQLSTKASASSMIDKELKTAAPVVEVKIASELPALAALLSNDEILTDTTTAFQRLFSLWDIQKTISDNQTGCEVAESEGLACIFNTGTWNNLRAYNRPAVIELIGKKGRRHHVLLTGLDKSSVSLSIGGSQYVFPTGIVDQYWYGKYLFVWRPRSPMERNMRLGSRGPSISWLRNVLANYSGTPMENQSDVFDVALQSKVRSFQREHRLEVDGVVGLVTLMRLNSYASETKPPTLAKDTTAGISY
jgi:general secretion pathway protein A